MIKINQYDCIELSEYNGNYSITLGYEDKSGTFEAKWCKREFGKGNEKNVPVKVPLGDKDSAVAALETFVAELKGEETPF